MVARDEGDQRVCWMIHYCQFRAFLSLLPASSFRGKGKPPSPNEELHGWAVDGFGIEAAPEARNVADHGSISLDAALQFPFKPPPNQKSSDEHENPRYREK